VAAPATELVKSAVLAGTITRPPRSLWKDAWWQFRRHHLAMVALGTLGFLIVFTLLGPLVYHTPIDVIDFTLSLKGPSADHLLGTDDLGRDLLARAMFGGRISIAVGLTSVLIAITLGTTIGAAAGFFNRMDNPLMRLTDLFLSLPVLPLLLVIIYLFRDSLRTAFGPELGIFLMIVGVIGVLNWMPVARLVRASFLSLKQKEFVEAARSVGARDRRIIVRHILPNAMSPILVAATIGVGGAILTDVPTWGRILYDARNYLDIAPHWAIFPGLFIFLTVLSINFIGDGLRDALDPRKTS